MNFTDLKNLMNFFIVAQKNSPRRVVLIYPKGLVVLHPLKDTVLAATYSSPPSQRSTIGADRFHFRVRYGIGCTSVAKTTKTVPSSYMRKSEAFCRQPK